MDNRPPAPIEIKPTNPLLYYNGRFDWRLPGAPSASYPGSEVVIRFRATTLSARMSTTRSDYVVVLVDGKPASTIALSKEPTLYVVARDLTPGEHTVVLFKRSEAAFGTESFYGLQMPAGSELLSSAPSRRNIEFIGDSITCGYGDEGAGPADPVSAANSNHFLSYAAVTARRLHADYVAVAVSGIRLTEPPGVEGIPTAYTRIHPDDQVPRWTFDTGPVPDVVVINLGTNDFRDGIMPESEWVDSYMRFLDFVRSKRPKAYIFLANGPIMEPSEKLEHLQGWDREVASRRRALGDTRISALDFEVQKASDGYGSDYHPSVKTHERMADQLVAAIRREVDW